MTKKIFLGIMIVMLLIPLNIQTALASHSSPTLSEPFTETIDVLTLQQTSEYTDTHYLNRYILDVTNVSSYLSKTDNNGNPFSLFFEVTQTTDDTGDVEAAGIVAYDTAGNRVDGVSWIYSFSCFDDYLVLDDLGNEMPIEQCDTTSGQEPENPTVDFAYMPGSYIGSALNNPDVETIVISTTSPIVNTGWVGYEDDEITEQGGDEIHTAWMDYEVNWEAEPSKLFTWHTDLNELDTMTKYNPEYSVKGYKWTVFELNGDFLAEAFYSDTSVWHTEKLINDSKIRNNLINGTNHMTVKLYAADEEYTNNTPSETKVTQFTFDKTALGEGTETTTDLGITMDLLPDGTITNKDANITALNITGPFEKYRLYLNNNFVSEGYSNGDTIQTLAIGDIVQEFVYGGTNNIRLLVYDSTTSGSSYNVITDTFEFFYDETGIEEKVDEMGNLLPQKPEPPDSGWDLIGWLKYFIDWFVYIIDVVIYLLKTLAENFQKYMNEFSRFFLVLESFFGFLPPMVVDLMMMGLGVGIILTIIKVLRR